MAISDARWSPFGTTSEIGFLDKGELDRLVAARPPLGVAPEVGRAEVLGNVIAPVGNRNDVVERGCVRMGRLLVATHESATEAAPAVALEDVRRPDGFVVSAGGTDPGAVVVATGAVSSFTRPPGGLLASGVAVRLARMDGTEDA